MLYLIAFFQDVMTFDTYSDCKHVADLRELSRPTYFSLIYANPGASCQHNVNIVCDFLASGIDHKYNSVLQLSVVIDTSLIFPSRRTVWGQLANSRTGAAEIMKVIPDDLTGPPVCVCLCPEACFC